MSDIAFIFDWSVDEEEFSIFRITKDFPLKKFDGSPEEMPGGGFLRYYRSEIRDAIQEDLRELKKSGRWHWRGRVEFSKDYWTGEVDEDWIPTRIERIR